MSFICFKMHGNRERDSFALFPQNKKWNVDNWMQLAKTREKKNEIKRFNDECMSEHLFPWLQLLWKKTIVNVEMSNQIDISFWISLSIRISDVNA